MKRPVQFLGPAEAAGRLGVSAKALRLYEERGLLTPARNPAGWRAYGPDQMRRGGDIVALRALGLSLAQVAGVLEGRGEGLAPTLAAHQALLEDRARQLADTIENVRGLRADLDRGQIPAVEELARLHDPTAQRRVEFELPWPWGGERFILRDIQPLNYIVGPLGSGKTRLASRLTEVLPSAAFLGLDRVEDGNAAAQLQSDSGLRSRVKHAIDRLVGDGATVSEALLSLLTGLEAQAPAILVVDLVEYGLDFATQQALAGYLRSRASHDRPLFLLTRSSAILDMTSIGPGQCVILCPANHSPPTRVAPYLGAAGYEAVTTCLATPEVRARTEGVIAWRPPQRDEFANLVRP